MCFKNPEMVIGGMEAGRGQRISRYIIRLVQVLGPRRVKVLGKTYRISPAVFNPRFYGSSIFMARNLEVKPGEEVLDMGTGSGILALTAACNAERVVAVDINAKAVRYAGENARLNGLSDKVEVVQGDLFSSLDQAQKFDLIVFNPPYLEGKLYTGIDHAVNDPGGVVLKRFLQQAKHYLKQGGRVTMVYSSIADIAKMLNMVKTAGWRYEIVASRNIIFETLNIYRLEPVE
ncbi:MAG: HemK2/MTQ2 family protein methyltransferase [Spirochaetota bacterium]